MERLEIWKKKKKRRNCNFWKNWVKTGVGIIGVPSILPQTFIAKLIFQMGKKWSDKKAKTTYRLRDLGLQSKNDVTGKLQVSQLSNQIGPRFSCQYPHFRGCAFQWCQWRRNPPYSFAENQDGGSQNTDYKNTAIYMLFLDDVDRLVAHLPITKCT